MKYKITKAHILNACEIARAGLKDPVEINGREAAFDMRCIYLAKNFNPSDDYDDILNNEIPSRCGAAACIAGYVGMLVTSSTVESQQVLDLGSNFLAVLESDTRYPDTSFELYNTMSEADWCDQEDAIRNVEDALYEAPDDYHVIVAV